MIVTLTGANSFGLQRELRQLRDAFVAKHGELAIERVNGDEAEFAQFQSALTSLPFLASHKLVILHSPSKSKAWLEQFEQLLGNLPETTDVILIEAQLDKRLSYYKFLKKETDFREFLELDQNDLARWLAEIAKAQAGTLSAGDARYLVERVGANQQLLANELDKLLLYDKKITRQTIEALTDQAPQSTIFQLLEAAFAGNAQKTLQLYAEQRAQKVEPPQIIAMLAWQLHVLAIIKTAGERSADEIAKEAKLNPFVVRKSQSVAQNLSLAELKKLISSLLDIDTKSKSTALDTDEALQNYLLKLAV